MRHPGGRSTPLSSFVVFRWDQTKGRLDINSSPDFRQPETQSELLSSPPAPQTHAGCPGRGGECWSSSARVHDALGGFVMRFLLEPGAQSLRLIFLFIFVMGVAPSPALTAGCPDRCVCDDQLVVQCAGQDLTLFPNDLPLATRQLIISNNRIGDLPALQLNYLSDLVYLDCSNNSLAEISESTFGNLRKLAYLDLSFNGLLQIEDRTFGPLASLVMLRLTDNPGLGEIHPDAFSENIALQVLDVSRNNLTALNISSLIALPALRSMGLSGNPWKCDCDTEDLCLWVQIEGFKFQDLPSFGLFSQRAPLRHVMTLVTTKGKTWLQESFVVVMCSKERGVKLIGERHPAKLRGHLRGKS
ncbi:unnamed protein product [Menidia menidia]|uniref:(Atlantic silverside) hypothetical protein n=1 Tax=Menidia menidia TaxID=238744 RepID=A0A8S4ACM7_9TELE|nr:unnamed protein product [Menidia menidia]